MTLHIALLRGVNVGGANRLPMAALKAMLTDLGFGRPRTLLQSGNAVFDSDSLEGADLEALLERELEARLGLRVAFRVRTIDEWEAVILHNPFPVEAANDPGHLLLMA